MNEYFNKRVCVVTGAGSGIGAALCGRLEGAGARVIGLDVDAEALARLRETYPGVSTLVVDVSDGAAVTQAAETIERMHGTIDLWINNAGVATLGEVRDLPRSAWERSLAINFGGQLNGVLAVYSDMVQRGHGQIVNVGSIAGVLPCPFQAPYVAAKYAVTGLTQALRMEGKTLGVKVNLVCPGGVDTAIWDTASVPQSRLESGRALLPILFWRAELLPAMLAAERILGGVRKDRPFIFTDGYSKACWVVSRWFPRFWLWFYQRHTVQKFRANRNEGE